MVRWKASIESMLDRIALNPLPTTFVIALETLPSPADSNAQHGLGRNRPCDDCGSINAPTRTSAITIVLLDRSQLRIRRIVPDSMNLLISCPTRI